MNQSNEVNAGAISVAGDMGKFVSPSYGAWAFDLKDIILIGEFTNEDGPLMEDHFVSFIIKNGSYYDAPLAARGMEVFINRISEMHKIKIEFKLTYSTSFSSRVIFPDQLINRPLLNYTKKPKNIFARLFNWTVQQSLTDEVAKYIKEKNEPTRQPIAKTALRP